MRSVSRVTVTLALILAGCGYTLVGDAGSHVLGRIAVHTPENRSGHTGLDLVVSEALRREVMRRPGAQLVEDEASADWVVSGRVLALRVEPASLSPVVLTLEYQAQLSLELTARARDGREVKGDASELRDTERFLSSGDAEAQRKNRDEALHRVSQVIAARFLDHLDEAHGG